MSGIISAAFNVNSPVLYVLAAVTIAYVVALAVFFLIRAVKRGLALGMDKAVFIRTARRAAVFSIAPAISIFIGVAALVPKIGVPLPWLRLSVIGTLIYETAAAKAGADALGTGVWDSIKVSTVTPVQYVQVALIMAIGCLVPLILMTCLTKKYSSGMLKLEGKDKKWGPILTTAMFMGFVGCLFGAQFGAVVKEGLKGWIPIFVMLISAAVTMIFGVVQKLTKWNWIRDYALPVSMVVGMVCSVPIYNSIVG